MAQSILEESKKAKHGIFRFLFKKKFFIIALIVIVVGAGAYYYYYRQKQAKVVVVQAKHYSVKKEDIKISVSSTGKVVARDGVELSFPVSGNLEVDNVYVKEGDTIKKGDKIASVKTETLSFDLRNAYASYQSALSNFQTKQEAATDSEIKNAQSSIDQAQVSLDQAKISLEQTTSNSNQSIVNAQSNVTTAQNNLKMNTDISDSEIVHNAYLSLMNTLKSLNITLVKQLRDSDSIVGVDDTNINSSFRTGLGALNATTLNDAKYSYTVVKNARNNLDSLVLGLNDSSSNSDIDLAAQKMAVVLSAMQSHLHDMQQLLDATITYASLSQSQLDGFKSTVNSNQSGANAATSNLNNATQAVDNAKSNLSQFQIAYTKAQNDLVAAQSTAQQNINNANISVKSREISLTQAKNAYADLIAPVKESDLASARSQLTSAAISVDKAKYNIEQATLTSPIDGVVAAFKYKVGDIILDNSTTKTVATIINNDTLYIEVNVEEADISKLKVGDQAQVTFDAVDGVTLTGQISFISLTSTTSSNGIVTYLIRVILTNTDKAQIREGMTASVEFITSGVMGVIAAPVTAVHNVGGQPSVNMLDGSVRNVTTGFTDGKKVEIMSGLEVGETVVY